MVKDKQTAVSFKGQDMVQCQEDKALIKCERGCKSWKTFTAQRREVQIVL